MRFNSFKCKCEFVGGVGGFTLVELLVVISVVGVLAGIMLTVLSPAHQQALAQDGVKKATLEKLTQGIEAFGTSQGKYPRDIDKNGNPLDAGSGDSVDLAPYINSWPDPTYMYLVSGKFFSVYVVKSSSATSYFKYYSGWQQIKECGSINITIIDGCS